MPSHFISNAQRSSSWGKSLASLANMGTKVAGTGPMLLVSQPEPLCHSEPSEESVLKPRMPHCAA
jgi:hypothetical protein